MEVLQAMSIVILNANARVTDSGSHVEGSNTKANLKITIMTETERPGSTAYGCHKYWIVNRWFKTSDEPGRKGRRRCWTLAVRWHDELFSRNWWMRQPKIARLTEWMTDVKQTISPWSNWTYTEADVIKTDCEMSLQGRSDDSSSVWTRWTSTSQAEWRDVYWATHIPYRNSWEIRFI